MCKSLNHDEEIARFIITEGEGHRERERERKKFLHNHGDIFRANLRENTALVKRAFFFFGVFIYGFFIFIFIFFYCLFWYLKIKQGENYH